LKPASSRDSNQTLEPTNLLFAHSAKFVAHSAPLKKIWAIGEETTGFLHMLVLGIALIVA